MKRLPGLLVGGALGLLASVAAADSPLTSTDFASAYSELPAVKEALRTHQVEGEALALLLSTRPTDEKAAVVNAIGWQSPGSARAFLEGLASKRGVEVTDLKLAQLAAVDRFVLGYLLALETYMDPSPLQRGALDLWGATPLALLDQAAQALPEDFTIHYVRGLLEAQKAAADSTCSAYLATSRVLDRFPPRKRNLRPGAVDAIQAYMTLYKSGCDKAPIVAPPNGATSPLSPEYDQIYSLARLGDTIVAGTQAGIVVWGADQKRPLAHRDEGICAEVLVWNGAAWAGCYGRLVRWDGKAWKSYLPDPGAQDSYAFWINRNNQLRVYRGAEVWIYKQEEDAFAPARGFSEETHHVLVRRNGDLWRVVFMKAIVGRGAPTFFARPSIRAVIRADWSRTETAVSGWSISRTGSSGSTMTPGSSSPLPTSRRKPSRWLWTARAIGPSSFNILKVFAFSTRAAPRPSICTTSKTCAICFSTTEVETSGWPDGPDSCACVSRRDGGSGTTFGWGRLSRRSPGGRPADVESPPGSDCGAGAWPKAERAHEPVASRSGFAGHECRGARGVQRQTRDHEGRRRHRDPAPLVAARRRPLL